MTVKISVFIPVYNGGAVLAAAIESVLAQAYPDWELIIGDNASDDGATSDIGRYSDPRILYHRWPTHVGMADNFNRTAALCRLPWVHLLAADDRLHPDCLDVVARRIGLHPRPDDGLALVMTDARRLYPDGNPVGREQYGLWGAPGGRLDDGTYGPDDWIAAFSRACEGRERTMTVARRVLEGTGRYYVPDADRLYGDVELAVRAAAYGDVVYVDKPLVDVVFRPSSHTSGWYMMDLAQASGPTYIESSLAEGMRAHERIGGGGSRGRGVVASVVARSHLRRASAHRFSQGGRGRRAAAQDIVYALRAAPMTILSPVMMAYWLEILVAPRSIHLLLRRGSLWIMRHVRAADTAPETDAPSDYA
jgi:hypothetical protein